MFTSRLVGGTVFSGLENYKSVLSTGAFWYSVLRTLIYAGIQVPVMIVIAAFFATMFDIGVAKWGAVFRTLFFIPFAVPTIVAGVMWSFLLEDPYGPFNHILSNLGFKSNNFFGAGAPLLGSIVVIAIWEWTGYTMVILFTALKSVPREVVESALNHRGAPALCRAGGPHRIHHQRGLQLHAQHLPLQPGLCGAGIQPGRGDRLRAGIRHHHDLGRLSIGTPTERSVVVSSPAAAVGTAPAGAKTLSRRQRREAARVDVVPLRLYGLKRGTVTVVTLLAVAFGVFTLIPLWWILVNLTKTEPNLFATFGLWFAHPFELFHNMRQIFTDHSQGSLADWFRNTLIYAFVGGFGATALPTMAGYGFSRFRFRGNNTMFMMVLSALLIPSTAIAIPLYILYARVHMDSTMEGIFLPFMVSPVGVYLMRVYIGGSVPRELMDAARVDGAGESRIFLRIALPLMTPAVLTVFLLSLVSSWNNFFLPFIVNNNATLDPLPVGVFVWFQHSVSGGGYQDFYLYTICAGFLTIIPIIIVFLGLQRYFRGGLLLGSVTG